MTHIKPMPKYVVTRDLPNRQHSYRYNPPQKYIDAGLVTRQELGRDRWAARAKAEELNARITEYLKQHGGRVGADCTLEAVSDHYMRSDDYTSLTSNSRKQYATDIRNILSAVPKGKMSKITAPLANRAYSSWLEDGVRIANRRAAVASVLFNYAIAHGWTQFNPFAHVKRKTLPPRKVLWTHDNVLVFLEKCYSEFETRNVGLIAQMAYSWAQRIGDMRKLQWSSLDLTLNTLNLTQSKRKASVHLPVDVHLSATLKQQHLDFGFQEYVAPNPTPKRGRYVPYSDSNLSHIAREIIDAAGLPKELCLMDLRRTAVTEMIEAGVDQFSIMAVSGHANPASVMPYKVNTLKTASKALQLRSKDRS